MAKHSQTNLRRIFYDTTRTDPSAYDVPLTEIEHRCIGQDECCSPNSTYCCIFLRHAARYKFWKYFQFSVSCGNQSAGIFISNAMKTLFTEVTNVQFDGTFYTVPIQFCHLWTLFVAVQAHPTCYTLSDDI